MEEENSENNDQKIPTNMVSKEERFLRMLFTYIRLNTEKIASKHTLEKMITKDKKIYDENIAKLKNDWITVYYNIYDYFITKQDYIYTYFYNELIYICKQEGENMKELKYIVISLMKICLKIYPPSREDIINYYQLFFSKDLDQNIFSLLMEIFDIIYSYNKERTYKEYFSNFEENEFYLFDGNSHIEIKLDKEWVNSGYKNNPTNDRSKTYYVLGFSFRYFKKFDNSKLVQVRFPSNKYLVFSIKDGILHCNLPFKDNIQIPIIEDKNYSFTMCFLKERIQIHINDTFYETTEGIEETAKNLIIGDKFFGLFYKIYSSFTFEPLVYTDGVVQFTHPQGEGKFHFFNISPYNVYESLNYPKKLFFKKGESGANVNFSGRVLFFNTQKSYMRSLKNYGNFAPFCILLMFFIYKPEYYKKQYVKLIFDKFIENCTIYENEKLFSDNNYLVQSCVILCNFPKEFRELEFIDYITPLIKYTSGFIYYLDILKLVYGYEPDKNKQPFTFHLIEVMIKRLLKVENINQLNEIRDILLNTLECFNLAKLYQKKENVCEDIYHLILIYFENYKSQNKDIYFCVPYYFWFITLYIFFFEIKNKIKEIQNIYNRIKENINSTDDNSNNIDNNDNNEIIKLVNYYILLFNNEKISFIFDYKNDQNKNNHLYISYIFKIYSRFKKNKNFEELINNNLKEVKNIFSKYKFETIDDYKDKSILNFLIPCVYKFPYISNSFKEEENSLILELLCEDIFLNLEKNKALELVKLFKNICINLKYTITETNTYLIYCIKNEIYKQLKKFDFKVGNSFYSIFDKDKENAKLLSLDISNLFGDIYSKLEDDKKENITDHNISEDKLKDYFDPNNEQYQSDYLICNTNLEEIITNMVSRKNWIKTTQEEQFFFNQNWSDFDFFYNPENKNPKFTIKASGTNDLKYAYLYRIPNIEKVIKHRTKKGVPQEKLEDLFKGEVKEPFPICVHLSTREIKLNMDFILKYHEDINLQSEKEYLKDIKKKYSVCIIGSTMGKGFIYVLDENTIEYHNYYDIKSADHYNCIDTMEGISTDKNCFYNPIKIYKITIKKENVKMFFKRINYYSDQALEIFLFLGGSWYFVFKEGRDEFLEEAGLIQKENKDKKEKEKKEIKDDTSIFDSEWRSKYMFRILYNDLNYKSSLFIKSKIKEPIGYINKYFRFPGDNNYWENTCLSDILNRWKDHKISTFTLIMYLNIFSGRTIEDKNQNPILPQLVLLNSNNQVIFRNLKIPIGQIKLEKNPDNLKRISHYDKLYKDGKDKKQAYFYPSSVSTLKNSLKYLSSIIPYNQISKSLFNDKNNYLSSLTKEINDSLTNINNLNESTPDIFYLSETLTNINNIKIDEIEIPKLNIINNNDYKFDNSILFTLTLNKILESKEVNDTIGNWIDLIFGCDQRSEKLKNIYRPECYLNDQSQLKVFENNKQIINNLPSVGVMPIQLLKSTKFNSIVTRKHIPLSFNFSTKQTISVKLDNLDSKEMLNFAALDSEKCIFYGESKIWNINIKSAKNNQIFQKYSLENKNGVIKELFNPKMFKKIFAMSRLYKYSIHAGNIDDVLLFYNHNKLDRLYHDSCKNKNFITAVEIIDCVGYEHYLLVGKQNGHIHHYKVDFETIDDYIKLPDNTQYPGYFYKSILRYHNKEVVSIKYNPYMNLWISSSKDGYVHIWNYNGYPILSVFIKSKNLKYAILSTDPIPSFVVYFDNELNCYLLNQIVPLRKLSLKTELYNFDIIKSNSFEDFLICQDDNKIYIISLPYLEIVHEINEKYTSFDYLQNERLIIGFLRHEDENKVTINKIKCDL